jgi:CRISPR-associated protein Cas5, subtype I-B/TNEAP
MKLYRIEIHSWTASFRYPNVISGYQPTLCVPPLSTILGLINACSGKYIYHKTLNIGYYFDYQAKALDLETIYQIAIDDKGVPLKNVKSNIVNREFLYDCRLFIYVDDIEIVNYFNKPYYQLLLGRSSDLATIVDIRELNLETVLNASKIKGQIIPFERNYLPGILQSLPKYFTDTIPRNNIGTEAYSIIDFSVNDYMTNIKAYRDNIDGKEIDIFLHKCNFYDE